MGDKNRCPITTKDYGETFQCKRKAEHDGFCIWDAENPVAVYDEEERDFRRQAMFTNVMVISRESED